MRWFLLLFVLCFIFSLTRGGEAEEKESSVNSGPKKSFRDKFQFPRRRFLRRRLNIDDGKVEHNVTTSVSMSVSKSASSGPVHAGPSSEPVKSRPLLFSRLNRPKLIFNKDRIGGTTLKVPRTTVDPVNQEEETINQEKETPSISFKPKARPSFGKPPTNRPIVKATLRKLYRPSVKTTASTATENEEGVTETEGSDNSPATITTASEAITTLEPQTTTTTEASSTKTTTEVPTSASNTTPKNMIIIPVPPSQRKPYHPVIMQVTKTPSVSSTEKPQTRVVTYKLNKMFVPLGIYGKVLPKSEIAGAQQQQQSENNNNNDAQDLQTASSTTSSDITFSSESKKLFPAAISPAIRHKGTSSEELQTSDDNSRDFAAAIHPSTIPLTEVDALFAEQQWRPFRSEGSKKGGKQFFDASQVDLTMNYKPDIQSISLTTQKPRIEQISLTTTAMPFYLSGSGSTGDSSSDGSNRRENYKNQNTMTQMGPPRPFDRPSPPKSLVESIKSTSSSLISSIPGLIHGGLSQLSILSNQFDDGSLFGGVPTANPGGSSTGATSNGGGSTGSQSSILGSASNAGGVTIGAPDEETLEYFRKRPHLINGNNFNQPHYSSGFKPVTAPPHFARAYYASTTTTPTPSPSPSTSASATTTSSASSTTDRIRSTTAKSVPTYEFHKPSLLLRSPKNFQEWKDSYVDQLIESSNRYKYATTASPFESELIRHHWNEINTKYTKNEIDEAKDRIYEMFAGPTPPSIEEMLSMRPPPNLSRSSSSAFSDLLKMFRVGFTIGSTSTRKPQFSRSFGTLRSSSVSDHDGWRPIKPGGEPFVSFNAGITFGTSPRPTSLYPGHGGTHFSSSSKPYIPKPFRNLKSSGSSSSSSLYLSQLEDPYNHEHAGTSPAESIRYSPSSKYVRPSPSPSSSPVTSDYSAIYYGADGDKEFGADSIITDDGKGKYEEDSYSNRPPSNFGSLYENDAGLEIIPSSVFYKQKEAGVDVGEIRAVLKPSGMSDHVVKSHIPQDVSNVPQISFPEGGKLPQQFQSLSQLQEYFGTAEPQPQNQVHFQPPLMKLIQQSFESQKSQLGHHQQAGLLLNQPVGQIHQAFGLPQKAASSAPAVQHHHYYQQQPSSVPQQFSQFGQGLNSFALNNQHLQYQATPAAPTVGQHQQQQQQQHRFNNHQHQLSHVHSPLKTSGDSGLGFTDFELPAGVDPDIAALLKAELDKDDIPEEFRKEFQEQEKAKQQKAQQQQQQHHRQQPTQPTPQRRADGSGQIKAVFHKPIPINPTLISPPKKGGRQPPPRPPAQIPRYVLELARKLRSDKNLQGIVRVTSRKDGGPPVEYLYPVRG